MVPGGIDASILRGTSLRGAGLRKAAERLKASCGKRHTTKARSNGREVHRPAPLSPTRAFTRGSSMPSSSLESEGSHSTGGQAADAIASHLPTPFVYDLLCCRQASCSEERLLRRVPPRAETNRRFGTLPASCDAWLTTSPPSGTSILSAPTSGSRTTCPQCLRGSVRSGFQTARAKHAGAIAVCTDPPNAAEAAASCPLRSALLVLQRLRETPAVFHLDRFNVKHFHDLQLGDSSREAPCVKVDRIRGLRSWTTRPAVRLRSASRRIGCTVIEVG